VRIAKLVGGAAACASSFPPLDHALMPHDSLILFGILGKISGVFLAIPNPVLGGVTTFLFATVLTSGIRVLSYITWSRKNRYEFNAIEETVILTLI
jgi:hypothetical protein